MKIGDRVQGVSCRLGGGTIQGIVVLVKENTLVVSTNGGNELIKKEGAEKLGYKITKLLINEFLKDKGYKKGTWELYQKHLTKFMEFTDGVVNPEAVMKAQKQIADTLPEASKKQSLGAVKKYLEWLGYYDSEIAAPLSEPTSDTEAVNPYEDVMDAEYVATETKLLGSKSISIAMLGKAFVQLEGDVKKVSVTLEHSEASEVTDDQMDILENMFGCRPAKLETRYVLVEPED